MTEIRYLLDLHLLKICNISTRILIITIIDEFNLIELLDGYIKLNDIQKFIIKSVKGYYTNEYLDRKNFKYLMDQQSKMINLVYLEHNIGYCEKGKLNGNIKQLATYVNFKDMEKYFINLLVYSNFRTVSFTILAEPGVFRFEMFEEFSKLAFSNSPSSLNVLKLCINCHEHNACEFFSQFKRMKGKQLNHYTKELFKSSSASLYDKHYLRVIIRINVI